MKKLLILLLCLALSLAFLGIPVSADGNCPINYSCYITHDDAGAPTIHFDFINTSGFKIVYAEYSAALYNRDFQPAMDESGKSHICRVKITNLSVDGGCTTGKVSTSLSAFPSAAHVGSINSLKVQFENGTEWKMQGTPESKADFTCKNASENGFYYVDDGDLHLCDSSQYSQAREWYYWDDASMSWVQFGNGLEETLPSKGCEINIKIVINCDPNNYCVKTIYTKSASIAATCTQNSETLYSTAGPLVFHTKDLTPPFEVALWDFFESESVVWYVWSDLTKKWQPFSNERGPVVTVYDKSSLCLKTVYNGDDTNYRIYIIYFI
ncbi:MAG: hypothetical protein J5590_05745 [Clostridia bacterium]|nr:hypothetical protein [Clostridia bacterium]